MCHDAIAATTDSGAKEVHLFHLKTEHGTDEQGSVRTWRVAADTLFDAIILVPDGNIIKAVTVELGAASGPERLVDCAEPQWDEPAVLRRHDTALRERTEHRHSQFPGLRRDGRSMAHRD